MRMFGARMHWLIAPFDPGCELTYGDTSVLLHLVRRPPRRSLEVLLLRYRVKVPGRLRARVLVRRAGRPVSGAQVSFAGAVARTGRAGRARLSSMPLELPGRFRALARRAAPTGCRPSPTRRPRLRPVGDRRPERVEHLSLAARAVGLAR